MNIREEVLCELLRTMGQCCSGAALGEKLNVSRTAIWKAVEQLKSEGLEIVTVGRRGYMLQSPPDRFSEGYFSRVSQESQIHWKPVWFDEVTSTNDVAKAQAASGAPEGTVILADRQTGGRGRMGKRFHSPRGNLYISMILRPKLPVSDMMAVTACTASAVHDALLDFGVATKIKWVNDLFLNGKKLCGILSEGSFNVEMHTMDYLIIGVGVNLQPDPELPDELRPIVTDISSATGKLVPRFHLAAGLLHHMDRYLGGLSERTFLPVYTEHSMTIGRRVRVHAAQGELIATACGYTEDAGLIVKTDDGKQEIIRTGSAEILD